MMIFFFLEEKEVEIWGFVQSHLIRKPSISYDWGWGFGAWWGGGGGGISNYTKKKTGSFLRLEKQIDHLSLTCWVQKNVLKKIKNHSGSKVPQSTRYTYYYGDPQSLRDYFTNDLPISAHQWAAPWLFALELLLPSGFLFPCCCLLFLFSFFGFHTYWVGLAVASVMFDVLSSQIYLLFFLCFFIYNIYGLVFIQSNLLFAAARSSGLFLFSLLHSHLSFHLVEIFFPCIN